MYKVKIADKILLAEKGEILSGVLNKHGVSVEHPCGGRGVCQKCRVLVNCREELSCRYMVNSDICVELFSFEGIYSETGVNENVDTSEVGDVCLCLDIGTTTLALALVDTSQKSIIKVETATNPQRAFGADVMSRIDYCNKNGTHRLQQILIEKINEMSAMFMLDKSVTLYVSGNVTMLHIFFGIPCATLGVAPYKAEFLAGKKAKGEKLGINKVDEVISLPSVHTFFGADLVAGMNYTDIPRDGKYNLLIDLGTNAEIVLYSENNALCTSAAAGPCFEGVNISCGMSATEGAIFNCECLGDGLDFETIGGVAPEGICGTGIVDVVACLLKNGIIDETGYMECEKIEISSGIFMTQKDIREYQLAKSAVISAISVLVEEAGISFADIVQTYISGGFSARINTENAIATGLLPEDLSGQCKVLNNSSLLGTVEFACGKNEILQFLPKIKYIDLACNSVFSEFFIENMEFKMSVDRNSQVNYKG